MTYKKIVEGMIKKDSHDWVEKVLDENGIAYDCVVNLENAVNFQKYDNVVIYYDCHMFVVINGRHFKIWVGGVVDEWGVCHSCIYEEKQDGDHIIWMAVESSRELLGITEFKIGEGA